MSQETLQSHTRFKDAPFFKKINTTKILIAGAGGVGSWLALFLTRCGYTIDIADSDTVSIENFAGQFFIKDNIGMYKTDAVKNLISLFVEYGNVSTRTTNINKNSNQLEGVHVYVSAADTVDARQIMASKWLEDPHPNKLFIDARLGAEYFSLKVMHSIGLYPYVQNDIYYNYMKELHTLESLEDDVCTYRQTTHIAAMSASYITSIINNFTSILSVIESDDANQQVIDAFLEIFKLESVYYDAKMLKLETHAANTFTTTE